MDLPPITVRTDSAVTLPNQVTATVEAVTGPNRYRVNIEGMLLDLEAELFLSVGDRLPLRVREQGRGRLVLELIRQPEEAASEAGTRQAPQGPPEVLREFVRMRAPLDPALVERAAAVSQGPGSLQAAAFLAAHGLDPLGPLVELLARLARPAAAMQGGAPLLASLADALASTVAESPADIPAKIPLLEAPATAALEAEIAHRLDGSPQLRMLDRLISAVSTASPVDGASAADQVRTLALLRSATPDNVEGILRNLPPLSRDGIQEVLKTLAEQERRALQSLPGFAEARAGRGTLFESADRLSAYRLMNQLSRLRADGITVLEVPVRVEGEVQVVPLRIRREGAGGGRPGAQAQHAVTVHVELSRAGLIHAFLLLAGKAVRIRFTTRDRTVRDQLEREAAELVEALAAQGLEASVTAQVSDPSKESIFDVFAAPGDVTSVDLQA